MTPKHDPLHGEDDQIWIGWKWFEYHAKQRLETLKFFTLSYGASIAFSLSLLNSSTLLLAGTLSIFSCLICIVFWQLDVRSRQLTEIGEEILKERWNSRGWPAKLNPAIAANKIHSEGMRFKFVTSLAFLFCGLFSVLLFASIVYFATYPEAMPPTRSK